MQIKIPQQIALNVIALAWEGRPRSCPKCMNVFTSTRDRGRCGACGNRFRASDVHGTPQGMTEKDIARIATTVTEEESTRIFELLIEKTDELPEISADFASAEVIRHYPSFYEVWDFKVALLRQALADGGELWRWSTSPESWEGMCGRGGIAVVQGEQVRAFMQTEMN